MPFDQANLYPYQRGAVDHLVNCPRAHLFASMGLGKTPVTLTAFEALRLAGEVNTMLVIAPLRVANSVWTSEPSNWLHLQHLRVQPILGTPKQRQTALLRDAEIYTTNPENVQWLIEQWGRRFPYDIVCVDESTRFKRPSGKRFRALKRVHKLPKRVISLTGTPAPNGLLDIWAPTYLLDSGERLGKTFGSYKSFWFESDYMGYNWTPRDNAEPEIRQAIADIALSIRAEDHLPIHEPQVQTIRVELPAKAQRMYREMEREMLTHIESQDIEAVNAGVATMKCRQIASGAVYSDEGASWEEAHSAKIEALQSIVEEAAGEPILVAYSFKHTAERIARAIPGAQVLDKDSSTIDKWNAGEIPVLLVHPASAGHGLSLQHGGRRIVFADLDFNLELHQQVIERIGPTRQLQAGYNRLVYVTYLAAADTIDEDVLERQRGKADTQEALLAAMRRARAHA